MSRTEIDLGLREALCADLAQWLPRQRWYGASGTLSEVAIEDVAALGAGDAGAGDVGVFTCVVVTTVGDQLIRYHVPLAVGPQDTRRPSDPGAMLHEDGERVVFDALADAATAAPVWRLLAGGGSVHSERGELSGGSEDLDASIVEISPLVREQSNTSLVVGADHLLKVMRKVTFAPSVELEMTRALRNAGFENVAPPEGWIHYRRDSEMSPALLALAQRFLHNGTEGWSLALTSLRDLYAAVEDRGGADDPAVRSQMLDEQGASFTPEAARLGTITARMHRAAAHATGEGVTAEEISAETVQSWMNEISDELDALLDRPDPALRVLRSRVATLRARIHAAGAVERPGLAIRIHGDYHLGQVLRTDAGWTILDFEGEPLRSVAERRRVASPLRDVAGMLRSFDYAAAAALAEREAPGSPSWEKLVPVGRTWAQASRDAFWAAYLEEVMGTPLLPDPGGALALRRAYEIQKAVYEVGYELAHRPTWISIPLAFLLEATP